MSEDREPQPPEHPRRDPLKRIEAAIEHDVEQAEAMAPIIASTDAVTRRVRSRLLHALPMIALVAIGAVLIGSGLYQHLNLDTLAREHRNVLAWAEAHPLLAPLVLVLGIGLVIATGLPGSVVLIVAGGVVFGTVVGAVLAASGDLVGGCVLYIAARRLFMTPGATPPALVSRIRDGFRQNPVSLAFFVRLVPVFPFGAVSVALAWLECRIGLFLVASWVGVLPSALIYAAIGAGLGDALARHEAISLDILAEPRFALPLIGLAGLALLPALLGFRRSNPPPALPPG